MFVVQQLGDGVAVARQARHDVGSVDDAVDLHEAALERRVEEPREGAVADAGAPERVAHEAARPRWVQIGAKESAAAADAAADAAGGIGLGRWRFKEPSPPRLRGLLRRKGSARVNAVDGQVRRQQRREGASETVPGDVDLPFLDLGAAGCDDEFLRWVKVDMKVESADASIDVQH